MRVEEKIRKHSTVYRVVSGFLWWKKVHRVFPSKQTAQKIADTWK